MSKYECKDKHNYSRGHQDCVIPGGTFHEIGGGTRDIPLTITRAFLYCSMCGDIKWVGDPPKQED